jgi:DNA-binding NarL/FixJ family response regulator
MCNPVVALGSSSDREEDAAHGKEPHEGFAQKTAAREQEVARLLSAGLQNKEIAAVLGTSVHTVRNQARRIYEKLRVSGRVQLAAKFRASGDAE